MKIRIESDGTAHGTRVFDADTGEQLRNVKSVRWELTADWRSCPEATCTLELVGVPVTLCARRVETEVIE